MLLRDCWERRSLSLGGAKASSMSSGVFVIVVMRALRRYLIFHFLIFVAADGIFVCLLAFAWALGVCFLFGAD